MTSSHDYKLESTPSCKRSIEKACRKNRMLREVLERKISEVLKNPEHYKPLKNELAGIRRVHVMKSFVLLFEVRHGSVKLIGFNHHDEVYRRQIFTSS
jgi:YafQ family addiction module toxin component